MADAPREKVRFYRFGPFEADVRAGELRKHGLRIKLRDQPFQILILLLDQAGEVVLREEIRRRLWPNNTMVEFDHGINTAIQKLRDALGDAAANPKYVETVARRGYRFVGAVESTEEEELPPGTVATAPVVVAENGKSAGGGPHFRILSKLGEGGMGVVYRAEDLELGRQVALKFLPPFDEPEGGDETALPPPIILERFRREARAAAAISHPNICTIYGVDEHESRPVIVMELVEGETLTDRIRREGAALPRQQALAWALQIADALVEAHANGVVHRDLKPGNIMIGKTGVKVLDFGLAKMTWSGAVTGLSTKTAEGVILGTVPYMSPEQAQGKETDERSDIFSFGLVLYEMLTGKPAFDAPDAASLLVAVLERQPPPVEPAALQRVVATCLAKDPCERFQTARDMKRALGWCLTSNDPASAAIDSPPDRRNLRLWLPWIGWGVVAAALAVLMLLLLPVRLGHRAEDEPSPIRLDFSMDGIDFVGRVSPDGKNVIVATKGRLAVRSLETGESRDLGVEMLAPPFWSPDGRFVAFPSHRKLMKVAVSDGTTQTITMAPGMPFSGGDWNKNGEIVFAAGEIGIFRVAATGGDPVQITAVDVKNHETAHMGPSFLPDGKHFVYVRASAVPGKSAIVAGAIDADPREQNSSTIAVSNSNPVFVNGGSNGEGYLIFIREGALLAQRFDSRRLKLEGEAVSLSAGVAEVSRGAYLSNIGASPRVLVFARSVPPRLMWYDRAGKFAGAVGEPRSYGSIPRISPDGTRAVVPIRIGQGAGNIWLQDLTQPDRPATPLTFGPYDDGDPVWSPGGKRIYFRSNRGGASNDLWSKPVDGSSREELLYSSKESKFPSSCSPDGRFLIFTQASADSRRDLWLLPLDGQRKPAPLLATPDNERGAVVSPNGRWIAYYSDESGRNEIYVRPFDPERAAAGQALSEAKWQVSNGYGWRPRWNPNGGELFFLGYPPNQMSADVVTASAFRLNPARMLSAKGGEPSADGQKFLVLEPGKSTFEVIVNWQAKLRK